MCKQVVARRASGGLLSDETVYHINPTGSFEIGGPDGDAGLTGRKIIVDTYGGAAPHGGGAFSGKDPTKVDRSAAYISRYLAKNIVAAGLARRCTIQLAYAIGVAEPLSLYVDTARHRHASATTAIERRSGRSPKLGGLTPRGIRTHLGLNKPIYRQTAAYGHFGRTPDGDFFPWEKTDLVERAEGGAVNRRRRRGILMAGLSAAMDDGRRRIADLRAGRRFSRVDRSFEGHSPKAWRLATSGAGRLGPEAAMRQVFLFALLCFASPLAAQEVNGSSRVSNAVVTASPEANQVVPVEATETDEPITIGALDRVRREIDNDANARFSNLIALLSILISGTALLTTCAARRGRVSDARPSHCSRCQGGRR